MMMMMIGDETVIMVLVEEETSKAQHPQKKKTQKSKGKSHNVQNLSHAHASSGLETQTPHLNDRSRTGQGELRQHCHCTSLLSNET